MGHGKLKKFAENETFRCLLQPDASAVLAKEPGSRELKLNPHPIKGRWGADMFGNDHPIVLELGCGKGDYTIALALRNPGVNYIGVDIKGARLWKGAKFATENALPNVAFLRTRIEFIDAFFGPGEVSQIWLTFSDPQLRGSENARLSSPLFLERYRHFLQPGGLIHLKTDSRYLYEYTQAVCRVNQLEVLASGTDIYRTGLQPAVSSSAPLAVSSAAPLAVSSAAPLAVDLVQPPFGPGPISGGGPSPASMASTALEGTSGGPGPASKSGPGPQQGRESKKIGPGPQQGLEMEVVFQVQTFYEKMFLEMGLPITYMAFRIDHDGPYAFPGEAFDHTKWLEAEGPRRSFSHQPSKR